MKGDFSILDYESEANFTGVLHQQGRVLLDRDWNESDRITRHLRRLLGRDTIGANVAAVPASEVDSLKVIQAVSDGSAVDVTLESLRVHGGAQADHHVRPASVARGPYP